jgi:hypothetical protein
MQKVEGASRFRSAATFVPAATEMAGNPRSPKRSVSAAESERRVKLKKAKADGSEEDRRLAFFKPELAAAA